MLGQGLRVVRATGGDPGGGCRGGTRQYSLSLPPREVLAGSSADPRGSL